MARPNCPRPPLPGRRHAHSSRHQGVVTLIADDERIRVVGESADGVEAIEAIERLRPDVVLMDVNMPRMNGVEATRCIHERWPEVRVVGLSVQDDHATRQSMIAAGAASFVSKSATAEMMVQAILTAEPVAE